MGLSRKVNHDFFKEWTPEMAYVLGFFAADGSMIRNARGGCFIEFHNTNRPLLLKIRRALGSNHALGSRPGKAQWKIRHRLQIGSKVMFADLQYLGFVQNKANRVALPAIPSPHLSHYLRGYFDGDGNVYFKKHFAKDRGKERWVFNCRFTSGSLAYLQDLHILTREKGCSGGFITHKNRGYELVFSHKDSVALFKIMYDTVPTTGLYLPRKYRLFRRAIKTLYPHNAGVAQFG
ncbi:MAG TPA: LAGLIDADG family homing endonuclease [Candidatus Paceibacterota bacterium]|nr:LAGLIDADG family homing endonuclease [Candidatus Paceibacterota bacterium]